MLNLIKDDNPLAFNLKLSQHEQLVKRFRKIDYKKMAILNYSLLNYLLILYKQEDLGKINNIIELMYNSKQSVEFILGYTKGYPETSKNFRYLRKTFY